jgi:Fe2+ transport system protein FeoA
LLLGRVSYLIAARLGDPSRDVHGDPIPRRDGTVDENPTVTLKSLEPGATGVFIRVSDSNSELLRFLSVKGIAPGTRLEVVDKDPLDGPLYVRFRGHVHPLAGTATRARTRPKTALAPPYRSEQRPTAMPAHRRYRSSQAILHRASRPCPRGQSSTSGG